MDDAKATILRFPLKPRMRIRAIIERCPALGTIAARLPAEDDPLRNECERVLANAFTLLLHLPDVTREEADAALGHATSVEAVTFEELAHLRRDPDKADLYAIWREVWSGEDDDMVRSFARYAVALIARLYRLEPLVRSERGTGAAIMA